MHLERQCTGQSLPLQMSRILVEWLPVHIKASHVSVWQEGAHTLVSVALNPFAECLLNWHLQAQSASYTFDIAIAEDVLTW